MFNVHFKLLVACVLLYCVIVQGKLTLERVNPKVTHDFIHNSRGKADLISLNHERFRRSKDDGREKFGSKSECTGNRTSFEAIHHFSCYCDHACFQTYSDCCPDYEKYCGRQKTDKIVDEATASVWKCVEMSTNEGPCHITGATGLWMIHKCPKEWAFDERRTKCEDLEIQNSEISSIPVVGVDNNITYRNRHCALCHGVKNYNTWNIRVSTFITPPRGLDLDSKLRFIVENGGGIQDIEPRCDQPRRYCAGRNFISSCSNPKHENYKECVNGSVEVVSGTRKFYKNQACGSCDGEPGLGTWDTQNLCGFIPGGFSLVFNVREPGSEPTTEIVSVPCPHGTVFDTNLDFCRKGYVVSPDSKLTNEFLVALWLTESSSIKENMFSALAEDLKRALAANFSLQVNQISTIRVHRQDRGNHILVATFRLTLTPFQSLIFENQHMNFTRKDTAFLALLNSSSTEKFTLFWQEHRFSVVKRIFRQLSCYGGEKFQSHEYEIQSDKIVVNASGEVFLLKDHHLLQENGGNITLCRRLILSDCKEGAYVPLTQSEYVVFPNLSIYHNATDNVFNFGEYLIDESLNKDNSNISNATQGFILPRNSTIAICLPFKDTFNETKYSTSRTSYGVRILTLIGFSISISCLILLLITYGLFQQLRTVPGMNLMNLSFSMLLSQLAWLIATAHFEGGTATCEVFAIFGHYIFQVSFLAMSVISYHTCRVFAQPFAGRMANKSWRKFIKYSAFVWLTPAMFVAICVILDKTEVFLVDYGRDCWLGTTNARLYLFLLPLALILLYNIYTFARTARSLSRHEKARRTLQRQAGKQNLLICTKLATLVGFPWLFAFLGVLFPDVETLEYLFVVFVCLQGLYIAMAFLFNKKTLKLYKDRWNMKRKISVSSTEPEPPTFQLS